MISSLSSLPDLVFLSEPQVYQTDINAYTTGLQHEYCYRLNSDDLLDPDLPQVKSRAIGGSLAMWRKWLDPHIVIHPTQSSAFLPLILQLPDTRTSVHIAVYLPTHGKDAEFISELANLKNCIDDVISIHDDPLIFIRGDGNCNPKNLTRFQVLNHFIRQYSLSQVVILHPTYHHFVGNGQYDSNIDVILYTTADYVTENISKIICRNDHPEISSHHDIILSEFSLPYQAQPQQPVGLTVAPRCTFERSKVLWTDTGATAYQNLVTAQLKDLRQTWLNSNSRACSAILIQNTNTILNLAASATNSTLSLNETKAVKVRKTPHQVRVAKRKLMTKHKLMVKRDSASSKRQAKAAQRMYRQTVRRVRLKQSVKRDTKLDSILTKNPKALYSYLRSSRKTKTSNIQKLKVGGKVYEGDKVGDGFYESMTNLKSCDMESLQNDPNLSHHFSNYEHILKICQANQNIPSISVKSAAKLLKRMKTHVTDIHGITPLHYLHAGEEGVQHYAALLNLFITDVNNATLDDLNIVLGIILYKGHNKDKSSDRSYRLISTCPLIAKSLDLYVRDLYQDLWDDCTASTQYQATGSSHELASLLVTELVQYSLNIADTPVYLLVLDAQSAYDRCLRQILCTELFMSGMSGSALTLINNRLENRSTVYEWDGQMLGPAKDDTGFEQGGINSGDFYKLYNNEQLKSVQASCLGVDIGSTTISGIGQADDVMMAAISLENLKLLARLTENYCSNFRVKLVASKTKLLPVYHKRHDYLVEYAKLVNSVTIDGTVVQFVTEAEHVGVLRSSSGNMPNILQRIASHKKALGGVSSAGMTRSHRGNPAASLRVHQLYAAPVLLSGLGSLVLTEPEINVIDSHFKSTIQNLQRLHQNTPAGVVFLLAGCLPGKAMLHCRQLSLFSMVCHLPDDPLHSHAKYILTLAPPSAKSWFQQVRNLCNQYGLPNPLQLLDCPPSKDQFRLEAKHKIADYWHSQFMKETKKLKSLKYFKPELYSLTKPHYMWNTAASNPFECSKSTILARMASGRYRTDMLCRHWNSNRNGYCRLLSCHQIPGTLEHLLATCPALSTTRESLYQMWLDKSVMYPSLHATIRAVLASAVPTTIVQFILEPLGLPLVLADYLSHGEQYAHQLSYLTRTFAFYMHRKYQKLLKANNDQPEMLNHSNLPSISAVTTRCDESVPAIPCYPQHLSPTHDSLPLLQPGPCHGGAPPSTSLTCNECCYDVLEIETTHEQHSTSVDIVQHTRVTTPLVLPVLCQPPATLHAPDVHDVHPDYVPVGGRSVRDEAGKCLTMANITY